MVFLVWCYHVVDYNDWFLGILFMKRKPLHHRKRFWNFIQAPQTTRGQLMNEPEWHIRSGLAIRPLGYHEVAIQSLSGDVFTEHAMLLPGSLQPTCWLLLLMKLWQMQWCWERGLWASSVVQLEVHYIFMLLKKLPSYQGKKKKNLIDKHQATEYIEE